MKNRSALLIALWMGGAAVASDADDALRRGAGAVAAIGGEIGGGPVLGAGILFARERDRLYIATANHVVRKGQLAAGSIQVKLRNWPNKSLPAHLLPQMDRELDLAVLAVDNPAAGGIDICALSMDVLAPRGSAKRGLRVYPVGNPNGVAWGVPVDSDAVMDNIDSQIVFESARIGRGHSGGALLDGAGRVVGMIQADEPPNGRALAMERIVQELRKWQLPMHLVVPDKDGLPPLFAAIYPDPNVDSLKQLLAQPCSDVNAALPESLSDSRQTPLHLAATEGEVAAMQVLLDAGAKVNAPDWIGNTPLEHAVAGKHLQAAKLLVAHGADVNFGKGYSKPLARAIERGDLDMFQFLMASGADPRGGCPVVQTVRLNSRSTAHDRMLAALIKAGSEVNCADREHDTPLTLAVEGEYTEAVRLLLEAGAAVNVKNRNGVTPMHLVCNPNDSAGSRTEQTAAGLLRHGAILDPKDEAVLLTKCGRLGWPEVAGLLVKRGVSLKGDAGRAPLCEAAEYAHADIARIFLQAGADPNAGDFMSPLLHAMGQSKYAHVDPDSRLATIQLLVSSGARVNKHATDYAQQEPLYVAVIQMKPPDLRVARFLIARGATITPELISTARTHGSPEAVALLQSADAQRKSKK